MQGKPRTSRGTFATSNEATDSETYCQTHGELNRETDGETNAFAYLKAFCTNKSPNFYSDWHP